MSAALASAAVLSLVMGGAAGAAGAVTPGASPAGMVRVAAGAPLPAGAVVTGATDPGASIPSEVVLKPRDPAALDAFVAAVSTPGSPEYHHYLGRGQFAADFGPVAATITSARSWLTSTGLTVGATSPTGC